MWKLDEGSGVVAGDSTANNLDGALKNGLNNTGWKSGADCKFTNGKCLEFDGINNAADGDYIRIPDTPTLDFGTNPFTIEGWVKMPNGVVASGTLIAKQMSGSNHGFVIHTVENANDSDFGRLFFRVNDDNEPDSLTRHIYSSSIDNNQWHHFAAVREGMTLRMYIDGFRAGFDVDGNSTNEVVSDLPTIIDVDNNHPLYIGVYRNGIDGTPWHGPFKGSLDELRIWNKALTDTQIKNIWNSGNGQQCLAPQKGSACDDELQTPACQPNKTICESGDVNLRCSIKSCTCQEKFIVDPIPSNPSFAVDSGGALACRNTAITVNFNENIDASTIKTAKTTVKVIDPPILSENFDALPSGWTTVNLLTESPHWNPYNGTPPIWTVNSGGLYEQSNDGSGLFVSPTLLTTTNYQISFDARVFNGTEAVGFVFGYTDDKNYYQLLWSDPQDDYASILSSRLVLRKKINTSFSYFS